MIEAAEKEFGQLPSALHALYKEVETYRSPEDLGSLVHSIEQYCNKVHIPASSTASLPEAMDIDTPEEESNSNAFAKQPEADIGRGLAGHGNAESSPSPLFTSFKPSNRKVFYKKGIDFQACRRNRISKQQKISKNKRDELISQRRKKSSEASQCNQIVCTEVSTIMIAASTSQVGVFEGITSVLKEVSSSSPLCSA